MKTITFEGNENQIANLKALIEFGDNDLPKIIEDPEPKKTYVLFGDDAVRSYQNEGINQLLFDIEDCGITYSHKCFDENTSIADILLAAQGSFDYCFIDKEDYEKIENL